MSLSTFLRDVPATRHRGILGLALNEAAVIQGGTATSDQGGGATKGWVAKGTVPCRIDPAGAGGGRIIGARIDERSTHVITTAPEAVIDVTQRVVLSGRGTYEVLAAHERTNATAQQFEVIKLQ